jgi:hypothetical protein
MTELLDFKIFELKLSELLFLEKYQAALYPRREEKQQLSIITGFFSPEQDLTR